MYYKLTNSQKKIARRVMDKGLQNHYLQGLSEAEKAIKEWQKNDSAIKESYLKLCRNINRIDNHIAWVYNNKGGSRWVEVMAYQLADGVISKEDLADFDEEVRHTIIRLSDFIGE